MNKKIFATCDCETDPFSLNQGTDIKPFVWGVYNGQDYYEFDSTDDFIKFIKAKPWNIYAHNGGKFDYMFLLEYLQITTDEFGEKAQDVKVINGRLSKFKIGRCTFFDSYNILPVPLSAYAKDEFEYWKLEKKHRLKYKDEISKYLKSDCINLYGFVKEFMERFTAKITLASTAAHQFEQLCAPMPESDEEYHDLFKPFYYGGRVTPFEMGVIKASKEKPIKIYDINSAYPTAMRFKHPYGTQLHKEVIDMGNTLPPDEDIENCFITLSCNVLKTNGMNYGCFPMRFKDGIDFPLGRHSFNVTGWEYIAALETGAIKDIEIEKVWWFTDLMSFENYVDTFYADKLEAEKAGDNTKRLFSKLMLNSQYGKFCQDSRRFKDYKILSGALAMEYIEHGSINGELALDMEIGEDDVLQMWDQTREFSNGMCIIESPIIREHTFFNIATGASITGWVRAFMWRSLCQVERPLYCDTDSIACFNGDKLPMGDKLGEWDLELDGVEKMAIAGKKLYAAFSGDKKKTACKGVRLSAEEIERVAEGEEVLYRKESPVFSIKANPRMLQRYVNRKDKKKKNEEKRKSGTVNA